MFVDRTEGFNGADVDYLCEKAKENAIKRILSADRKEHVICKDDFDKAFLTIKSSVLDADKNEMQQWEKEYAMQNA